jgi:hypothetical protein
MSEEQNTKVRRVLREFEEANANLGNVPTSSDVRVCILLN